jgi:glycosyltransferase involved in cell wall biosynthesis
VGFVARLSVEKNVGLFLLAAHHLLQSTSFMRFTIVGDGDLKPRLMELARRLRIDWAVHFTGWVGADLPRVLKGFDVVVNPSLRAWSETFCIANIEVMSMRIPLVTFAVGGKCSKSTSPNGYCNAIHVLYALL